MPCAPAASPTASRASAACSAITSAVFKVASSGIQYVVWVHDPHHVFGVPNEAPGESSLAASGLPRRLKLLLALLHLRPQAVERIFQALARHREHLALFFLDVVLDVLHEHLELGLVRVVPGVQLAHLAHKHVYDVVLLQALVE